MECAGGIVSGYDCEGPEIVCPVSEDLRSHCPGESTRPICDAEWEGRMDERSEGASPGSGRDLNATGNLGECGGETRARVEARRSQAGYHNLLCPFVIVSKLSNALKPSLPISPHDRPQSTIAVHLACSPTRMVPNRSASSSLSLLAN